MNTSARYRVRVIMWVIGNIFLKAILEILAVFDGRL